jgi:hypothetical protein
MSAGTAFIILLVVIVVLIALALRANKKRMPASDRLAEGGQQIIDCMKLAASHAENKISSLRATLEKEANELSSEQLDRLQNARIYGIAPEEVAGTRPEILRRRAQGVDPSSPLKKRR